jgi:hypothetical protein
MTSPSPIATSLDLLLFTVADTAAMKGARGINGQGPAANQASGAVARFAINEHAASVSSFLEGIGGEDLAACRERLESEVRLRIDAEERARAALNDAVAARNVADREAADAGLRIRELVGDRTQARARVEELSREVVAGRREIEELSRARSDLEIRLTAAFDALGVTGVSVLSDVKAIVAAFEEGVARAVAPFRSALESARPSVESLTTCDDPDADDIDALTEIDAVLGLSVPAAVKHVHTPVEACTDLEKVHASRDSIATAWRGAEKDNADLCRKLTAAKEDAHRLSVALCRVRAHVVEAIPMIDAHLDAPTSAAIERAIGEGPKESPLAAELAATREALRAVCDDKAAGVLALSNAGLALHLHTTASMAEHAKSAAESFSTMAEEHKALRAEHDALTKKHHLAVERILRLEGLR